LRILPLASEDQSQNIIKISENEALLTTPSKSYMYEFDHIITEPPNYLYDSLPHAIINDLLSGKKKKDIYRKKKNRNNENEVIIPHSNNRSEFDFIHPCTYGA
jgi:hypothetical protein